MLAIYHRARARAVVIAVPILEIGRVPECPVGLAGIRPQAFHHDAGTHPVHVDEVVALYRGRAVPRPLGKFPDQGRPGSAKLLQELGLTGDRLAAGTLESRPILDDRAGRQRAGLGVQRHPRVGLGLGRRHRLERRGPRRLRILEARGA